MADLISEARTRATTVLGGFSTEVLGSSRVLPGVLTEAGFTWAHPDIDAAVATIA